MDQQMSFNEYKLSEVRVRLAEGSPLYSTRPMSSPEAAVDAMANFMKTLPQEYLCVVNLDARMRPINFNIVTIGSINQAMAPQTDVFRSAILSNASAVIVMHNHPSGDIDPSSLDIDVTNRLIQSGKILGVQVEDHIIIGGGSGEIYSFRENGHFADGWNVADFVSEGKGNYSTNNRVKEITNRLEKGITEYMQSSEDYKAWLDSMSKFHRYSVNNCLLIAMQRPDASQVASYSTWQKLGRQVERGEKGIKIISPAPYKKSIEINKTDSNGTPVIGADGKPEKEMRQVVRQNFKVATVFDVSQTTGDPLPEITSELTGTVDDYGRLMTAITASSPVPIRFAPINSEAKGYYHNKDKEIVIKEGMSQEQTVKTAIHEVCHSMIHDRDTGIENEADRQTKEIQAESTAYTVCNHFGIDTSDYSFGYIAAWSTDKELSELKSSMQTIRQTSTTLIDKIDARLTQMMQSDPQIMSASNKSISLTTEIAEPSHGRTM